MRTHRILFLAANPLGLTARKLDEEARQIEEEIRLAKERDQFAFVARLAARPMDLLRALREVKPSIVHFAGHSGVDGIYLTGDNDRPARVTRDALCKTFGAAGQSVQIVVLNGGAMEDVGQTLCDFVPICVGMPGSTCDDAVRAFNVGFYGALASSESAARACLHGTAAMHLQVNGAHDRPCLYHRGDIDPETFFLISSEASATQPQPCMSELTAVLEIYRARKRGAFERWDLRTAGPTPTVGNRPAEIKLDEMYIPLRFDPALDPSALDRGAPIHPEELLGARRPQVVIGCAGAGKTTWMRWMFRRLIERELGVPFFLELRTIAAAGRVPLDAARSIESYLADALAECGAADPGAIVSELLTDSSGPRPVVLIDGWDELGAQGERLRERLVEFCRAYPHAVVVVSSRPYGATRPAGAEAFATLYIQPLSNDDVRLLASRFHRRVEGHDEPAGARATDELMAALGAAPDARSLAGTALLLTMMMLLSREGPLPDRRHKLYTACLRNMLLHRVAQREREGVAIELEQQWRPDDSEERLRAVAELAYRMQLAGYTRSERAPMVCAWDDAVDLLEGDWTRDQRERFLRWLVASAGVLIDRTDGSVQFAHLSFQEHLAAYFMFITCEGDERVAMVQSHVGDAGWWETLRLWAALVSDLWPDRLGPVLDALRAGSDAYWLAGQIFADGSGGPSDFDAWVAELPGRLSDPFTSWETCASSWGACKQTHRRARVAAALASARASLHWLDGTWHASWCDLAGIEIPPAPALIALEGPIDNAVAVARSCVLHGAAASWPDGGELAMLRLWPSIRVAIGVRLQTAASLGVKAPKVQAMFPPLLAWVARSWSIEDHARVEDLIGHFAWDFGRDFSWHFGRDFVRDFGRYFVGDFGRDLVQDFVRYFVGDFVGNFGWCFDRGFVRDFGRNFVRYFGHYFSRDFGRDFGRYFGRDLGLSGGMLKAMWLPTFAVLEISSVAGRAAPRAALAHGRVPDGVPLLALFRAACRASFSPDNLELRAAAAWACDTFDGDPIWPALARHVARISTADDRALLEDLARHPEKREPPLSWGLQHYVRGDLVLDDDSVVTLDELCARSGLGPLPLLEDMPDELDFDITTEDVL